MAVEARNRMVLKKKNNSRKKKPENLKEELKDSAER